MYIEIPSWHKYLQIIMVVKISDTCEHDIKGIVNFEEFDDRKELSIILLVMC